MVFSKANTLIIRSILSFISGFDSTGDSHRGPRIAITYYSIFGLLVYYYYFVAVKYNNCFFCCVEDTVVILSHRIC
jgi:hypothetical protein